ncbi:MAG TPA: hypothetical protein VH300_15420 [Thermoleophilaceae bacterium]|nr:hypothetical protein [Thermoleophilaceae bacterium]
MEEEAVADRAEKRRDRFGLNRSRRRTALLARARQVSNRLAEWSQEVGQALAQKVVTLRLEHRFDADSRNERIDPAGRREPGLKQRDQVRQAFELTQFLDRERLLEDLQRSVGEQLLFAIVSPILMIARGERITSATASASPLSASLTFAWRRSFVDLNPISHLVTAERGLMNGTPVASQVVWVLVASAALTGVFAPLTMHLYRRKG